MINAASAPAIRLSGVRKTFGPVRAVDGIDLEVTSGEIVAFLGPNGAGKTTTIDMLLGLSQPTTGHVEVLGRSPTEAIAQGRVAAVMQAGGLLKDITVAETLELVGSMFASSRPVTDVMARAGIIDLAGRRVGKCSGGQQQRLRFAMALLPDPELLILDEPTTGMDVEGRRSFWAAIRRDAAEGRTVLFATHYLDEADAYADRIVLLRRGRIVADGTAGEIRALSAGRTLRATWPGVDEAALAKLPATATVERRGDTVIVASTDTDAVARYLLTKTNARDVEITSHNLEEAFLALTGDEESEASPTPDNVETAS